MITIDVYIANLNKKNKWTGGQYKTKLGQNALFLIKFTFLLCLYPY